MPSLGKTEAFYIVCCLLACVRGYRTYPPRTPGPGSTAHRLRMSSSFPELEKVLQREYASFFSPMERKFYDTNVQFIDPLTSFTGIDKYQDNVDMLAGRSGLGGILFKDASIALHKITSLGDNKIQTRWTLQFTMKILPWQPRPRFTGVSIYTVDPSTGKVLKQDDYWDAINLFKGKYKAVPFSEGLQYFLSCLSNEQGAEQAAPELPFELLRRAATYDVRRYPSTLTAETLYDQRPEGYDRLGSYAGGSNVKEARVPFFSPTIMFISDGEGEGGGGGGGGKRAKIMMWPLAFETPGTPLQLPSELPEPTVPRITLQARPGKTYAIGTFQLPATEVNCRTFTSYLLRDMQADGLKPTKQALQGDIIVAQFDALFSLNKRRVEVWVELEEPDGGGLW